MVELTRIFLVRHGETRWNAEKRYIGVTDLELTDKGRRQAQAVGRCLAGNCQVNVVFSSSLIRANETGKIISDSVNAELKIESELNEIDFGKWEGLTAEEILRDYPEMIHKWQSLEPTFTMPQGENWLDFQKRVRNGFNRIYKKSKEESVALVSHAGVIKTLVCQILGIDLSNFWRFELSHGAISVLEFSGSNPVLTASNNTRHLAHIS